MNQLEWEQMLEAEGFTGLHLQEDPPNKFCPDHTHKTQMTHALLEGQIVIKSLLNAWPRTI